MKETVFWFHNVQFDNWTMLLNFQYFDQSENQKDSFCNLVIQIFVESRRHWTFVIDQYVNACIYGHVTNCELLKMLLKIWRICADCYHKERTLASLANNKHNKILLRKLRTRKGMSFAYYIFWIIIQKFNNGFHNSINEIPFCKFRNRNGKQKQIFQPLHKNV